MKDVLAIVGAVCLVLAIIFIITLLFEGICELIDALKWRHKYKHRFDKSPTAKCYCVDCKYYNKERNWCSSFNRVFGDSSFCRYAEPRKKE